MHELNNVVVGVVNVDPPHFVRDFQWTFDDGDAVLSPFSDQACQIIRRYGEMRAIRLADRWWREGLRTVLIVQRLKQFQVRSLQFQKAECLVVDLVKLSEEQLQSQLVGVERNGGIQIRHPNCYVIQFWHAWLPIEVNIALSFGQRAAIATV